MEDNLREVVRGYFVEQYFGGMSPESQGMSREQFDMAVNRMLDMAQCDLIPLEDLYFADLSSEDAVLYQKMIALALNAIKRIGSFNFS